MKCPACKVDMEPLVAGIYQCPQCKKIIKEKDEKTEEDAEKKHVEGDFQDGEYFHNNAGGLNKRYEIAEKGITITKTANRWFAVLICQNAYLKSERYIRLSWWTKSYYGHGGMIKIHEKVVLKNLITTLEKIDEAYDDFWGWHGKFGKKAPKTEEQKLKEKNLEIIKYRIIENKTCPNCQKKMDKEKFHYECSHCGEIVILEGYNMPIFDRKSSDLDLDFQANYPINFYLPVSGITIKWLMAEWKALVVIYSKDNPNKKWLRFYWWSRDLKNIMRYGQRDMGAGAQMGWSLQRGVSSPNIYDKKELKPLIEALKKIAKELNWEI